VLPQRELRDVRELVAASMDDLDLGGHALSTRIHDGTCNVDPTHVERIVQNLVGNAVKYTPDASPITLTVRTGYEGAVVITVSDEGPGIPEAERKSVFEPFHRLADASHAQGAGVGLALVARFARMHGGRAWITDSASGGCSFHVLLPGPPRQVAASTAA
jgi:signal transduction histidine kinase